MNKKIKSEVHEVPATEESLSIKDNIDKESYYGFTIKINNRNNLNQEDYQPYLKMLSHKGDIIDFIYEYGKSGKLHIHGIVNFYRKNPLFKSLCPYGYHTRFEKIYDIDGWNRYMQKEQGMIDNNKYML